MLPPNALCHLMVRLGGRGIQTMTVTIACLESVKSLITVWTAQRRIKRTRCKQLLKAYLHVLQNIQRPRINTADVVDSAVNLQIIVN